MPPKACFSRSNGKEAPDPRPRNLFAFCCHTTLGVVCGPASAGTCMAAEVAALVACSGTGVAAKSVLCGHCKETVLGKYNRYSGRNGDGSAANCMHHCVRYMGDDVCMCDAMHACAAFCMPPCLSCLASWIPSISWNGWYRCMALMLCNDVARGKKPGLAHLLYTSAFNGLAAIHSNFCRMNGKHMRIM